jgi:hypothetical protein
MISPGEPPMRVRSHFSPISPRITAATRTNG